jgi:hypothetical protein
MAPQKTTAPQKTMTTRFTNPEHPAIKVSTAASKQKQATKAEAQAKREAEEARKVAAMEAKKSNIQKVANLEDQIAQENNMDATPLVLQ